MPLVFGRIPTCWFIYSITHDTCVYRDRRSRPSTTCSSLLDAIQPSFLLFPFKDYLHCCSMEKFFVKLERDPSLQLSCFFIPDSNLNPSKRLIVFLNGINIPHKLWYPVVQILNDNLKECPPMLLYDRVGQLGSIRLNKDVAGRPSGHGRDCLDATYDLREVIAHTAEKRLGINPQRLDSLRIIIAASSVSCAIARLYAAEFPKTVAALVLLDSTLANSDTVSIFPDPESPGFSSAALPTGVTPELCADSRRKIFPVYGSESRNPEGLWRGTLPSLLPHSDSPKLEGPDPGTPYVTVIQHDPEVFPLQVYQVFSTHAIRVFQCGANGFNRR